MASSISIASHGLIIRGGRDETRCCTIVMVDAGESDPLRHLCAGGRDLFAVAVTDSNPKTPM